MSQILNFKFFICGIREICVFFLLLISTENFAQNRDVKTYSKSEIIGNVNPSENRDFDKIKSRYTTKSDAYLRDEVYDAFKEMWKAAKKDGVDLTIISAFRSRSYQMGIWNRKWAANSGSDNEKAEQILRYSSMPGTSRHHWGTDFDLNSLNNNYFEGGAGLLVYRWLQKHANEYGFYQPYTAYNSFRDAGYREEKWHWSYLPLASKFQRAYSHIIDYQDIDDFEGSEVAKELEVINNYVEGVEAIPADDPRP